MEAAGLDAAGAVGAGLKTREIATRLFLSVKTVETHFEHIKTKLGLENGRELIRYAVQWTTGDTPGVQAR